MKGEPTLKAYETPDVPQNLSAIHRESTIFLSWTFPGEKKETLAGFRLYRSHDGDASEIAFIEKKDVRSFADTDLKSGMDYTYRIFSENTKGIRSIGTELKIMPLDPPPPPANLSFTVQSDSLVISWPKADEGYFFNLYKSLKSGNYSLVPLNTTPLKDCFFQDALHIESAVYYTVRSLRGTAIRDEGSPSAELVVDPASFIPSSPGKLEAVTSSDGIYLLWEAAPESWVKGYRIYRKFSDEETFTLVAETQTPAFSDLGDVTKTRMYRVTSVGPVRESAPAEIKNIFHSEPQ